MSFKCVCVNSIKYLLFIFICQKIKIFYKKRKENANNNNKKQLRNVKRLYN